MNVSTPDHNHDFTPEDKILEGEIDRLVSRCRQSGPQQSSIERIKMMTHARIAADRARRRRKVWGWISAAACVAVLLAVGLKFMLTPAQLQGLDAVSPSELAMQGYYETVVPAGTHYELTLADGTVLYANAHTRVICPERFDGSERRIYANGEVYLKVAKDPERPFIVESDGFSVKVLGTVFNLRNCPDGTSQVVLAEGSVAIDLESGQQSLRLKPNDMATLADGSVKSLRQVNPDDYTMWIKGLIYLDGVTMSQLSSQLADYFGTTIDCHQSLAGTKIYGKLDLNSSLDSVLESLKDVVAMKIDTIQGHIVLQP